MGTFLDLPAVLALQGAVKRIPEGNDVHAGIPVRPISRRMFCYVTGIWALVLLFFFRITWSCCVFFLFHLSPVQCIEGEAEINRT